MADLEISDEVVAWAGAHAVVSDSTARDALEAAAPLVVAAELERLADEIERRAKEMLIGVEQMKPDVAAAVGAGYGARMAEARRLRARASELRGDGRG